MLGLKIINILFAQFRYQICTYIFIYTCIYIHIHISLYINNECAKLSDGLQTQAHSATESCWELTEHAVLQGPSMIQAAIPGLSYRLISSVWPDKLPIPQKTDEFLSLRIIGIINSKKESRQRYMHGKRGYKYFYSHFYRSLWFER